MAASNIAPWRTRWLRKDRRMVFGLVVALLVIAFGAAAFRWYRMDSAFDRCISYLQQIEVGMPVTEAVKLMDQARLDGAFVSSTTGYMGWQVACSRDDGCIGGSLANELRCWMIYTMLDRWANRAMFVFSSDGTAIAGISRELCDSFSGDSALCTSP
jgi:hypothetical protein